MEMKPQYVTDFVLPTGLFDDLVELDWLHVTEARSEYFMSDEPREYIYGKGVGERLYKSNPFIYSAAWVLASLNSLGAEYNVCFLNRYDGQRQHLGWHSDDSPTMDHNHPISVISLGAAREIWWRPKGQVGEVPNEQRQMLHDGSLFVMPGGFQRLYEHRIPKNDRPCATRISLTFRRYL